MLSCFILYGLIFLLTACTATPTPSTPTTIVPTLMPTPTPDASTSSGWRTLRTGIAFRQLEAPGLPVQVVRIDPAHVRFVVGYDPTAPVTLSAWVARYGAVAAINGGFFDQQGEPVALLISNQQVFGYSYVDQGGMFAIDEQGKPHLWSLADQPYDGTPFVQAIQGWPLLVRTNGEAAYTDDDGQRARRSAIALDRNGYVLLIVAPGATFSLAEWSQFLATADLDIEIAVNLDGGSSSSLIAQSDQGGVRVDSFTPLPFALLILEL